MRTEIELRNDFSKQKNENFYLNIVFCKTMESVFSNKRCRNFRIKSVFSKKRCRNFASNVYSVTKDAKKIRTKNVKINLEKSKQN